MESRRTIRQYTCMLILFALLLGIAFPARSETPRSAPLSIGGAMNGMVRVGLTSLGQQQLDITVSGTYSLSGNISRTISSGSVLRVNFSSVSGKLTLAIGSEILDMGDGFRLRRHSSTGAGFRLAQGRVPGNLYPADLSLTRSGSGTDYRLTAVAYVFIEDYLYGVLPYEMGNSSHIEALKAQAVAARTYTVKKMGGSGLYDLVDTTSDQVYAGTPSGNANCRAAVDATRGIVVQNGSGYTSTLYTASNGGQTESAANAWGSSGYSYLNVRDDPYDLANPQSSVKRFEAAFNPAGMNTGLKALLLAEAGAVTGKTDVLLERVTNVVPHTPKYPAPSRLYTKLDFFVNLLVDGVMQTVTLRFDIFSELESALGLNINSGGNELWSVSRSDTAFVIAARRYGHGIGMSQRGAMHMGAMGYTYDQILGFYYPNCQRVSFSFSRAILSPYVPGEQSGEEITAVDPAEIGAESEGMGLVAGAQAHLYQKADAASLVLTTLPKGTWAKVLKQTDEYYGVEYGLLSGYIKKGLLSYSGAVPGLALQETALLGFGRVVNTSALNLRSGPSTSSSIYLTIPGGALLPIFSFSGNYARVQYGRQAGYVSLDFIDQSSANPPITFTGEAMEGLVRALAGGVPLRAEPSLSAAALANLAEGDSLTILSMEETWAQVFYQEQTGYVLSRNIELRGPSTSPVPTPPPGSALTARVETPSGSLNLRAGPSQTERVLRTIPRLEEVIVFSKGVLWCEVAYLGQRGHVMTQYLDFSGLPGVTPAPSTPPSGQTARVQTPSGSLNLRDKAQLSSLVLSTIPRGTEVEVLEFGTDWCRVRYQSRLGYVQTGFLIFEGEMPELPEPTNPPSGQGQYARVTTASGSLNLREAPSLSSLRILSIPRYDYVLVQENLGTWIKCSYNGRTGYALSAFLTIGSAAATQSSPSPTPAPSPSPSPALQEDAALPTVSPSIAPDEARDPTLLALPLPYSAMIAPEGSTLNLRAGCSMSSTLLKEMPAGDRLLVTERGEEWCKVIHEGKEGYCMTKYLDLPVI